MVVEYRKDCDAMSRRLVAHDEMRAKEHARVDDDEYDVGDEDVFSQCFVRPRLFVKRVVCRDRHDNHDNQGNT